MAVGGSVELRQEAEINKRKAIQENYRSYQPKIMSTILDAKSNGMKVVRFTRSIQRSCLG